jgi:phage anti-repressor protein
MELIKIRQTENGKQAVQCSELYKVLGLAPQNYSRWIKRNILKNRFAILDVDYSNLTLPLEEQTNLFTHPNDEIIKNYDTMSNKNNDFVLTLDFAKKLAMLTRTEKGEQVRNYFLQCERIAHNQQTDKYTHLLTELQYYRRMEQIRATRRMLNAEMRLIKENLTELLKAPVNQLTFNF